MERRVDIDGIESHSFISDGHGIKMDAVTVDFNASKYAMVEDKQMRNNIEKRWEELTSQNNRIYNKSKFRMENFTFDETVKKVHLEVGLTDYKDLQGTNLTESSSMLVDTSKDDGTRFKRLSQAIGVGGWVITKDKKTFFIQNATWKGEQGGKLDRPGGHPEPEEASIESGEQDETKLLSEHVLKELFTAEQKEIRDEINIGLDRQSEPELLGAVFNLNLGGRIGLEFKIDVDLTSEEILQLYSKGDQKEADETTGLVFFDLALVTNLDHSILSRLTPHATGSLRFLQQIAPTLL